MRKAYKYIFFTAVAVVSSVFSTSCSVEEPFKNESGDGNLRLHTNINGNTVTRADIDGVTMKSLRDKAIVYVERKSASGDRHDVIRKYFGLDEIPTSISLQRGNTYLAEGWTGDSVSASFDAKFYRGKTQEFKVETQTIVSLKLNIANVLVSFAPETFDLGLTDLTMTVGHSRGELIFSETAEGGSTLEKTGYFMMPSKDKSLTYTISAKTAQGEVINRTGTIENVQRAHEYQVRITSDEDPVLGAGLIKIEIEDIPVIAEEVEIFGKPDISGIDFDLGEQVIATPGEFTEKIIYIAGYNVLSAVAIGGEEAPEVIKNLTNPDITNNTQEEAAEFENIGIHIEHQLLTDDASGVPYDTYYLYISKEFFDNLPVSKDEYVIGISAVDRQGKYNTATLRIANTEEAITVQAPVEAAVVDMNKNPMAVKASSATLTGYLYDPEVDDYGIEYRERGAASWTKVSAKNKDSVRRRLKRLSSSTGTTRGERVAYNVTVTGLKAGTTYEYRAYATGYANAPVMTFTTEQKYVIPNASFEDWSSYTAQTMFGQKSVVLPWSVGDKEASFWGSGNEGAATANLTLTDKSTNMTHSGTYSARLESKSAVGVIAAGNIFMGTYVKTDGTNGVLSLGRPYNGSHPKSLKVWANYRPGTGVKIKSENKDFLPENFEGGNDHGQIYVALTTEPVEIRTNPNGRKLFNADDACVLAYGEKTWTGKFGPDGELASVEIPIEYNDRAKTQRPQYLVIVVSASKYGDYFSGATGSVFYLDDFELNYE